MIEKVIKGNIFIGKNIFVLKCEVVALFDSGFLETKDTKEPNKDGELPFMDKQQKRGKKQMEIVGKRVFTDN